MYTLCQQVSYFDKLLDACEDHAMRKGRASLIEDIKVGWSLHLKDKQQTTGKRSAKCFQGKEEGIKSTDARVDLKELQECMDKMGGFATLGRKAKKVEGKGALIEEALDLRPNQKSVIRSKVYSTTFFHSNLEKKLQMYDR